MPLLDGGELSADKSNENQVELSNQFFVTDQGGVVDNEGKNLVLQGAIQSIANTSENSSPLSFEA